MASRRSNRSHKVPGVKLRPAQPQNKAASSSHRRPPSPEYSQYREDFDASYIDPCPRPFKGVILCATGVEKSTIFAKAGEMGANTTSDFTDVVTHLIAQDHGSAKYRCAVERKIPIMKPSWILENFEIWQRGDEFDLDESIAEHRLPIFSNVVLSLSGIQDVGQQLEITRQLTLQGGRYEKDLGRPVRVTHILCSGDEETDKMKYARKFNSKGEANIQFVWDEWFWDSLEFGGRFDETKYLVTLARPQRKQLPPPPPIPHLSDADPHRASDIRIPTSSAPSRQADSINLDDEETAVARRVPAATLQVWESLLRPRGFVKVGRELVRAVPDGEGNTEPVRISNVPTNLDKGKGKAVDQLAENEKPGRRRQSGLSTFSRTKSFAQPHVDPLNPGAPRQPFRNGPSMFKGTRRSPAPVADHGQAGEPGNNPLIFSGLRFRARGEARSPIVQDAVKERGGLWADSPGDDEDVDYIIVRLFSGSKLFVAEPDENERGKYRTECWLEGCLSHDRIRSPDEHPSFLPVGLPKSIDGADKIVLSHSGIDQLEAMWVKRLASALGVSYTPTFTRASTHLLCESAQGAKYDKAREWGVSVVDLQWLSQITSTGIIPSIGSVDSQAALVDYPDSSIVATDIKPFDTRIVDITNDPRPHTQQIPAKPLSCPKQSLARAATVPDLPVDDTELFFGRPVNGLLTIPENPSPPRPTPLSLPALSRSSTGRRSPTLSLSAHASAIISNFPVSQPAADNASETEEDEDEAKVPSSSTPSPLKMPSRSVPTSSPLKPAVSDAGARALQESITNILGKRTSADDSEPAGNARPGKRARPRSKPQSRHDSGADASQAAVAVAPPADVYDASYAYSEDIGLLGGQNPDESGMVMYEDAAQQAERKRLMTLLGGPNQPAGEDDAARVGGSKKRPSARKRGTSRVAGF